LIIKSRVNPYLETTSTKQRWKGFLRFNEITGAFDEVKTIVI